ncbi:hypothetical protein KSP35_18390 [Aquihabitans sp. G128]|uniref:hypothetical protein n=1 Tax=Aquihabitans sp. G128 TaxID=2849779 RepID=UPI001C21A12F|nr:hypothetical protein [Aquihabitans sp. G128]QXC60284.1 hypothetical protein KSP35_18390 [Aquihabitans sp. G128]
MAAYPWRDRYFADIQRTPGGYWPFTEYRPDDFSSPYVNIKGWLRRSYRPKGDVSTMPTIWMFGGSTTWGEGQRDDYTIASYVARLSERDGLPVRMDNYGERGWTHFQEMILYEQELGLHAAPDFSIFYDGANEITSQSLLNVAIPTHTLAYTYAEMLAGKTIATRFTEQPQPETSLSELYHTYSKHSAIHKVVAWFRPSPAAASTGQGAGDAPGEEFTGGQQQGANGSVSNYQTTPQDGTDAGKVYENGKQLTMALSKRYDVRSFLFWQPVGYNGEAQQNARDLLTSPTIDIADTLAAHPEVFIDGGHTNEEGARLVAVEIWKHVKPAVQKWYEEHR